MLQMGRRSLGIGLVALLALTVLGQARAIGSQAGGNKLVYLPQIHGPALDLPFDPFATRNGQATFYDADGGGNCSFDPTPSDLMVGAMNQIDYYYSLICGAYLQVSGPK